MSIVTRKISLNDYLRLSHDFMPGWLYHGEPWLTAVRDGFEVKVFGLYSETKGGEAVALSPVMGVRKGPFLLLGSPIRGMYTEFVGPLFPQAIDVATKREAIVSQHLFIKSQGAGYVEWGAKCGKANKYLDILDNYGYECVPRQTLVVNLGQGIDKVWSSLKGSARNKVRKAEKNGVTVRITTPSIDDMTSYYNMLTETFRRQGASPPHPLSFYHSICERLIPAKLMRFVVAEKKNRVISGALFLCYGERMMYMSGTSTEEGLRLAASSLVQWEAMKQAAEIGVTEYDLGGTGNASIDKFKASFGGKPYSHHRWVYRTWPVKLAETGYNWIISRRLLRLHG